MIEGLLRRVTSALTRARIPYMIIGGQAVLFHGHPRLTQDVDVTLGVDVDAAGRVLAVCRNARLTPLVKRPLDFARETHVLPARDGTTGLRVDFVFSNTPYERHAIRRAVRARVGKATVAFASLEDVIIHKLVAGRAVDVEDVRVLLARRGRALNVGYLRRWLKRFSASGALEHDPLKTFESLRRSSARPPFRRHASFL